METNHLVTASTSPAATDPVTEVPNATVSSEGSDGAPSVVEAWVDAAEEGGEAVGYVGDAMEAAATAVADGTDVAAGVAAALAEAGADTAAATCWTGYGTVIAGAIEVVAGLAEIIVLLLKNEVCTLSILNNTPYTISFDTNPGDEQIYLNHGKLSVQPQTPLGPTSSSGAQSGTFVFESMQDALFGTTGAIDLQVVDQNNSNTLITWLSLAWNDPYSGTNWVEVVGNSGTTLQNWYNQVVAGSPGAQSGVLIQPSGSYPGFLWSAAVSSTSGSNIQIVASLSVLPPESHHMPHCC